MKCKHKCDAQKANNGRGWSIVALPGDSKKYHRCNRVATVHVNNPGYGNHGPIKIWLCDECDKGRVTHE